MVAVSMLPISESLWMHLIAELVCINSTENLLIETLRLENHHHRGIRFVTNFYNFKRNRLHGRLRIAILASVNNIFSMNSDYRNSRR